jgi:glycosyltransferase involved in cell wall biosynthesis
VNLFDYFVHPHAHDLAEDAGPETPAAYFHWRRASNAIELLDLENATLAWTPTCWQRDLYPSEYHDAFLVLYDGVDTHRFAGGPRPARTVGGRVLPPQTRVVSFVARSLDRVRGFDRFLELANRLMKSRTDVLFVAVGDPIVHRGLDIQFYRQDYPAHVLAQTPLVDPARVWFLSAVLPTIVAEVLAASDLTVYPSRSYPVAHALLEAMAMGCTILAWDTAPLREFLTHGQTGLLVEPNDPDAAERLALAVLDDPSAYRPLGEAATRLVHERYAQEVTLPALAAQFDRLVQQRG